MNNDIDELTALNRDYIASVQSSDVKRFDEILAAEFYCSNPDKTLIDRAAFLKQTAVPVTIKNLAAHDVKIRVLGDFAIIHAATSYTTAGGQQAHGRYSDCWANQYVLLLVASAETYCTLAHFTPGAPWQLMQPSSLKARAPACTLAGSSKPEGG